MYVDISHRHYEPHISVDHLLLLDVLTKQAKLNNCAAVHIKFFQVRAPIDFGAGLIGHSWFLRADCKSYDKHWSVSHVFVVEHSVTSGGLDVAFNVPFTDSYEFRRTYNNDKLGKIVDVFNWFAGMIDCAKSINAPPFKHQTRCVE